MSRNLNPATETATLAEVYRELLLVELDFASGTVYAHSGAGNFVWNGNTYLGIGRLGKVSEIEETEALQANAIKLELSGVDPADVSISLNEEYQGRPARLYIAYLDENYALTGAPVEPFSGQMDTMDGEMGKFRRLRLRSSRAWWIGCARAPAATPTPTSRPVPGRQGPRIRRKWRKRSWYGARVDAPRRLGGRAARGGRGRVRQAVRMGRERLRSLRR